jgi:ABC-type polysaccharide/polyol phosphate transport system ATPase subunit
MFSIATSVEPDILLLDELLGAGDVTFRAKAMARMNRLLESSKAMIVVTHNLTFAREKAKRAVYMEKGRVVFYGEPNRAVDLYLEAGAQAGAAEGAGDPYLLEEV